MAASCLIATRSLKKLRLISDAMKLDYSRRPFNILYSSLNNFHHNKSFYSTFQRYQFFDQLRLGQVLQPPGGTHYSSYRLENLSKDKYVPFVNNSSQSSNQSLNVRDIDQIVFQLQMDIRKLKRVHRSDIEAAIDLIENGQLSAKSTVDHGQFLLSLCGELMPDVKVEERNGFVDRLWRIIRNSSESINTESFAGLLKVYAENNHSGVDPLKLLEEMKTLKIPLSGDIYHYALVLLCQRGNIKKSAELLSAMKADGITINERYFNALILGNARAGDLKSATNILEIMKASHVEPSSETYITLMQVFIEAGQMDDFRNAFNLTSQKPDFSNECILKLLKIATISRNSSALQKVLDCAPEVRANYYDVVNIVKEIVHVGHPNEALQIIKAFLRTLKMHGEPVAAFFIKEIICAKEDGYIIRKICASLVDEDINEYAFQIATESSYREKRFELATELLQDMGERQLILRPHYFLPLIVHQFDTLRLEGLIDVMDKMKSLNVVPDWNTSYEYIVPRLFSISKDPLEVVRLIKTATDISYSSGILSVVIAFLLKQRRIKDASMLVKKVQGKVSKPNLLVQQLANSVLEFDQRNKLQENLMESISVLHYIKNYVPSDDKTDYVGSFLIRIMESVRSAFPELWDKFLKVLGKSSISVSENAFEIIEAWKENTKSRSPLKIDPDKDFHDGSLNSVSKNVLHPKDMNVAGLELHVEELTSKHMNARGALRKLFLKSCQANDLSKALNTKRKFEKDFGQLSTGMNSALLGIYVNHKLLELAKEVYSQLKATEKTEDFAIDFYKILDLASLTLENNFVQEAIDLVMEDCLAHPPPVKPKQIRRNVVNFLEALAKTELKQPGARKTCILKEMVDLFIDKSIAEANSPTISILIRHYIDRGEIDLAVDQFEYYSRKYKITPGCQHLTYAVLNKPALLQKVVQCNAEIRGEVIGNHDLAFAKSDVGDVEGAKELLLNLGNRIKFVKILNQCEYLSERREFDKVINLGKALRATKRNYDCSKLYLIALRACQRFGEKNEYQRILNIMQEADMHVPQDFLRYGSS